MVASVYAFVIGISLGFYSGWTTYVVIDAKSQAASYEDYQRRDLTRVVKRLGREWHRYGRFVER